MGQEKLAKDGKKVANKHLHARISFLYQAGVYISGLKHPRNLGNESSKTRETRNSKMIEDIPLSESTQANSNALKDPKHPSPGLGPYLASHLQAVSRKSQIRLSHDLKRSICKRCTTILTEGSSSQSKLENASRGGKKPWADVLVVQCLSCGAGKRYPVGASKQVRKNKRKPQKKPPAGSAEQEASTEAVE